MNTEVFYNINAFFWLLNRSKFLILRCFEPFREFFLSMICPGFDEETINTKFFIENFLKT